MGPAGNHMSNPSSRRWILAHSARIQARRSVSQVRGLTRDLSNHKSNKMDEARGTYCDCVYDGVAFRLEVSAIVEASGRKMSASKETGERLQKGCLRIMDGARVNYTEVIGIDAAYGDEQYVYKEASREKKRQLLAGDSIKPMDDDEEESDSSFCPYSLELKEEVQSLTDSIDDIEESSR